MTTKICTKCKETKDISEFHKKSKAKDGLQPRCKSCTNTYLIKWQHANPDKVKASKFRRRDAEKAYQVNYYLTVAKARRKALAQ